MVDMSLLRSSTKAEYLGIILMDTGKKLGEIIGMLALTQMEPGSKVSCNGMTPRSNKKNQKLVMKKDLRH